MASELQQAIEALGSPDVSLSSSLRKLLIVARRINSDDLTQFVRSELNGYDDGVALPEARIPAGLKVSVQFDGPGGSVDYVHVGQLELPKRLAGVLSDNGFREPLAELEALANNAADSDPRIELPYYWVHLYREHAENNEVPHIQWMVANKAYIRMPRTVLHGVLDRVRTHALDLALDIEHVAADAGEPAGPTVLDKPELADVVDRYILVNAAAGSTVTIGNDATVASGDGSTAVRLEAGDVDGLIAAVAGIVSQDAAADLRTALETDGGEPGENTASFLDRVKSGAYTLAAGMTASGAYEGLVALVGQVFGAA